MIHETFFYKCRECIIKPATVKVYQKGARICYNVYFDGVGAGYSVYSYSLK